MTEKEAIKVLELVELLDDVEYYDRNYNCGYREALKIAIETLENQIPKKPHIEIIFCETDAPLQITGTCPICHWLVRSTENKYCGFCGQSLDWKSEVEDATED